MWEGHIATRHLPKIAVAVYDDVIFKVVRDAEADLERRLAADIIYFNSEIRMNIFSWFREVVEKLDQRPDSKDAVAIFSRRTSRGGREISGSSS
jgi:hypothetical protein